MAARILTIDIETSPNVAHVWGLFKQTVSLNQLMESTEVISFAAKWYGEDDVVFCSVFDTRRGKVTDKAKKQMIQAAWKLLDEADIVVGYNHITFDMPHLNREFLKMGMTPPSPYQNVDLLQVAKTRFRFTSNKLQYVSTYVGLEGKVQHEGHTLWVKCMAGDPEAWAKMAEYNIGDVIETEQLYDVLLPWIGGHPHAQLYSADGAECCQRCGSTELKKEGFAFTKLAKYQQYSCKACGSWSRGKKALQLVDARGTQ